MKGGAIEHFHLHDFLKANRFLHYQNHWDPDEEA